MVGVAVGDDGSDGCLRSGSGSSGHRNERRDLLHDFQKACHPADLRLRPDDAGGRGFCRVHRRAASDGDEALTGVVQIKLLNAIDGVDRGVGLYLGKEYSFGEEIEDTYGALTMASKDDYGASTVSFEIKAGRAEIENRGDVDGDGKISSGDARLALRASVKLENYPAGSAQFAASDVNRDGKISPDDARTILRVSVRLESFL